MESTSTSACEIDELRQVSVRFDQESDTYFCFYRRIDDVSINLTLSYSLNEKRWLVETEEFQKSIEEPLNNLVQDLHLPFEEQIRHVIRYLDHYFTSRIREKTLKNRAFLDRFYPLTWLRRLTNIRRYASQQTLPESSNTIQRHSAPAKSARNVDQQQTLSVKLSRKIKVRSMPTTPRLPERPPAISEICLEVKTDLDETPLDDERLKLLAEKFVTYFSGTFQCDLGHTYYLDFNDRHWSFTIVDVKRKDPHDE